MSVDLQGKRAFVCGASQGIGRACAMALAARGAAVIGAARSADVLDELVRSLPRDAGQQHSRIAEDFNDPPAVQRAVEAAVADGGPIQVLVNNTGGPPSGTLLDARPDDFLNALRMHVGCNQLIVQALLPGMKSSGYGRIVNIISTSVVLPIRGLGVSNTTRGAVANWARSLADELAPLGITVNNVLPGFTDTPRLRSLLQKRADKAGVALAEMESQARAGIPMRRFADPLEIAAVVAFLASPAASYITGVNLPVDGGRLAIQ